MRYTTLFNQVKKTALLFGAFSFLFIGVSRAQSFSDIFKNIVKHNTNTSQNNNKGNGNLSNLNNSDISAALRQALEIGAKQASQRLSQKNGFFENAAVKILMPPDARQVASTLRQMGMGDLVDDVILKMNRAAEDAAVKAAPIFINAIKGMTIQDALHILTGPNNAATQYLEAKTTPALTAAFSPIINQSLEKVGAPKIWQSVFTTYNKIPFVKKVNPNLVQYVTQQALKGVFTEIAQEELKIRTNPAAQTTNLLRNVFGSVMK